MDKIQPFRHPMVTATGIFLGFMLDFMSTWLPEAFQKNYFKDLVTAIAIPISIGCLMTVLFRVLSMNYPEDEVKYYRKTLLILLVGIAVPFVGFLIVIIQKLIEGTFA